MKTLFKFLQIIIPTILIAFLSSCGVAPVNSSFEGARTLKKGQTEISGNYSSYSASSEGDHFKTNRNVGVRLGFGLGPRTDLRVRYERIAPVDNESDGVGVNYLSITPKYSFLEDKISGSFTVGTYSSQGDVFYS